VTSTVDAKARRNGRPRNAKGAPAEQRQLTPAESAEMGKAARDRVSRSSHAQWAAPPDRSDPISLLEEQAETRVPELVPIRYGRMLVSPFAFYRGAALVMASDLSRTDDSGFTVQACGDAHMSNFGVFGTPERRLTFDINDFDETLPGPWEWDVKRLVASLCVAARDVQFADRDRRAALVTAVEAYRAAMQQFAAMRNIDVWNVHMDVENLVAEIKLQRSMRQRLEQGLAKARTKDSMKALEKLTVMVDGEPRIISDPPLLVPIEELGDVTSAQVVDAMHGLIEGYRRTMAAERRHLLDQFRFVHVARKVVGVGSVGTRAWVLLMLGRDNEDPLFLQAKEAQASVLERFTRKCEQENQGERVVVGQRLMQTSSDLFLGWERVEVEAGGPHRDFYVRQLQDWKGSVDPTRMVPEGMTAYARLCGWTLARAHARTGNRIAIAAYLGNSMRFAEAISDFAEAYADQNQRDYEALQAAVASGRVVAETGI
jgi:uncharacterized protein (DUF2252 family)